VSGGDALGSAWSVLQVAKFAPPDLRPAQRLAPKAAMVVRSSGVMSTMGSALLRAAAATSAVPRSRSTKIEYPPGCGLHLASRLGSVTCSSSSSPCEASVRRRTWLATRRPEKRWCSTAPGRGELAAGGSPAGPSNLLRRRLTRSNDYLSGPTELRSRAGADLWGSVAFKQLLDRAALSLLAHHGHSDVGLAPPFLPDMETYRAP